MYFKKEMELIGNGTIKFEWFYCNVNFSGYFAIKYSNENLQKLIDNFKAKNHLILEEADRSYLIHSMFVNAYSGIYAYKDLTDLFMYLKFERDYLPWKTLSYHLNLMLSVLEYRQSFYQVSVNKLIFLE